MKRPKSMTGAYGAVLLTYWAAYSAFGAFANYYLLELGFSDGYVGLMFAVSGLLSAVLQTPFSAWADRDESPSLTRILAGFAVVSMAIAVTLRLVTPAHPQIGGLLFGVFMVVMQTAMPLLNALGMAIINQGHTLNFGRARAVGSVGYASIAYGMGLLTVRFGAGTIPVVGTLFLLVMMLVCLKIRLEKVKHGSAAGAVHHDSPIDFAKQYPRLCLVLVGCLGVFLSHMLINNFAYTILLSKGGDSSSLGTAVFLACAAEIPAMILFARMSKRVQVHHLLMISAVVFTAKSLLSILVPSVVGFYLVQLLQFGGWGIIAVALVYYVDAVVTPEDSVKGQSYAAISQTAASVIGSVVGGLLIDHHGINAALAFVTVCAAVGTLVIILNAKPVSAGKAD